MSSLHKSKPATPHAEKRALWEVRQRYNVAKPRRARATTSPTSTPPPTTPPRASRSAKRSHNSSGKWVARVLGVLVLMLIIGGGIFGYKVISASNKITVSEKTILGQLSDLLFRSGDKLKGEEEDRINIMLIAVGGEGHSGENLADTIMIASIRPSDHTVALMSIPRDLYVQVPDEDYFSKINAVHAYGESRKKDGGPELLKRKIEEITGQTISYYGRVDFIAFKGIVDAVGGVNITIPNSFDDYWHKISFPAGTEKMNGERALAYARARYVEGPEGGDFKRAGRQQQLLLAIQEKVFSVNTALDFNALNQIMDSLSNNIRTDMQLWEIKRLYEIVRQVDDTKVHSAVLTTGPKGVLVGDTQVLGGVPASILRTRTGDYTEIQTIANNIFSDAVSKTLQASSAPAQTTTPTPTAEPTTTPDTSISIEVRNGTNITGLAQKTADGLTAKGYTVATIGNASTKTQETTTVYAKNSSDAESAKNIASAIGATTGETIPTEEGVSSADILIILGTDAQ